MKRVFAVLAVVVPVAGSCLALDADKIRELAAAEHDPEGMIPELQMFANGREFEVVITAGAPGGERQTSPAVKTEDKVVDKRYLVSKYRPPRAEAPVISVITWEPQAEIYRKFTLMPDGKTHVAVATALPDEGVVSWMRLGQPESGIGFALSAERHEAGKTTWREVTFTRQGQISYIVEGTATKVK